MTVGHLDFPQLTGKEIKSIAKVVAAAATPEPVSATTKRVRKVTVYGCKALDRTPNAQAVFIGNEDARPQQLVPYDATLAGGEVVYSFPETEVVDLNKLYVEVQTDGDGVVVSYLE